MLTKLLYVLIQIRIKDEVGTVKHVYALKYFFDSPFQEGGSFMSCMYAFCYLCFLFVYVMLSCLLQPCDHLLENG